MGNKFEWTDERALEFADYYKNLNPIYFCEVRDHVKEFKKLKESTIPDKDIDWEIISFYYNAYRYAKTEVGIYYNEFGSFETTVPTGSIIQSVRRISDNETFTIGDLVQIEDNTGCFYNFSIKKFELEPYNNLMVSERTSSRFNISLLKLLKPKVPLFTTEDGVEIFDRSTVVIGIDKITCNIVSGKGDTLGVWTNGWYTTNEYPNPKQSDDPEVLKYLNKRFLIFYNKEKAMEWLSENKPIEVSYKGLMEFLTKRYGYQEHQHNDEVLKDFFKSKINL